MSRYTTYDTDYPTFDECVAGELTPVDTLDAFNDMLDEIYSFEKVGGDFAHMLPSRVLAACDEIAHRCGHNDYCDSQADYNGGPWTEVGDDWYDAAEVTDLREQYDDARADTSDNDTDDDTPDSEA